jgi:hypothetical protein
MGYREKKKGNGEILTRRDRYPGNGEIVWEDIRCPQRYTQYMRRKPKPLNDQARKWTAEGKRKEKRKIRTRRVRLNDNERKKIPTRAPSQNQSIQTLSRESSKIPPPGNNARSNQSIRTTWPLSRALRTHARNLDPGHQQRSNAKI